LLLLFLVFQSYYCFFLIGKPYERGFNCDDESIRYPYKDNTISSAVNYIYSTTIPIITVIIIESVYHYKKQKTGQIGRNSQSISLQGCDESTKYDLIWQIYCRLVPFAFGALISQVTTDIAKYSIGRLRPHFIDVCQPMLHDGTTFTLDNPLACDNYRFKYITEFEGSQKSPFDDHSKRDARLSFMSGHSSFAAYCLIYLVIYLQVRLKWSSIGFVRPLYQALLIYLVVYTGFSRISDYKHHWSDVLTGLIQGTIVAILTTYFISDLFVKRDNDYRVNDSKVGIKSSPQPNYNSFPVEMEEMQENLSS